MSSLKRIAIGLALTALGLFGGCDFHEESPPLEGAYEATRFEIPFGESAVDVLAAGGRVDVTFERNGDARRVEAAMLVPEQTIFPEQERVDTTFTGSYVKIVDRVTLEIGEGPSLLPTTWTYENGRLRSDGSLQIELARK